jgi:superfamily II DNA or RNA helicase
MLNRFSSRLTPLDHGFLRERLRHARRYDRIAGYFRSSILEVAAEELEGLDEVRIVCNSDLDPADLRASQEACARVLKARFHAEAGSLDAFLARGRYRRLVDLLTRDGPKVEIRVVDRHMGAFLHGKGGIIEDRAGNRTCFIGSVNETREGWSRHYELLWEDTSEEGAEWLQAEFDALWNSAVPLPEAVITEIKRCAERVEVALDTLTPAAIPAAALVETRLYHDGRALEPWQQALIAEFVHHRETYGKARLLLADEVGVGKTLSLAGSALVSVLLGDGPSLILCPATLTHQWQGELRDKLGLPSGRWNSIDKTWVDAEGRIIRTRGAEDIARCPFQIGIVSTGLIFRGAKEVEHLLRPRRPYGCLVLDEAHRARRERSPSGEPLEPNNLLAFMLAAAGKARHVVLGTATPIQTDPGELFDLLEVLAVNADHVLGRPPSFWSHGDRTRIREIITGKLLPSSADEAWDWIRNPLPPKAENTLFDDIRIDLDLDPKQHFTDAPRMRLDRARDDLEHRPFERENGLLFFQRYNPVVRHTVLRTRQRLEELGLMTRVAVDTHPDPGRHSPMFEGRGLFTSDEFDLAYKAAEDYSTALAARVKSAGFLKSLLLQRLCSSFAAGLATARVLLADGTVASEDPEDESVTDMQSTAPNPEERAHLQRMIDQLSRAPADPKLEAVIHYLENEPVELYDGRTATGWLQAGCIVFSQYFDTVAWVAEALSRRFAGEAVALYAGAGKSAFWRDGQSISIERDDIKRQVQRREIRLLVATDAACEGLNLQTLGTLINIDLPWNPSRLEQRLGRIKRYGQTRRSVDMLNLVYAGTRDERVYKRLSQRMKDRFDIFGSLPDTIEDAWIEDVELLDRKLDEFIERKKRLSAFDLRYGGSIRPRGEAWELCTRVLSRADINARLAQPW